MALVLLVADGLELAADGAEEHGTAHGEWSKNNGEGDEYIFHGTKLVKVRDCLFGLIPMRANPYGR